MNRLIVLISAIALCLLFACAGTQDKNQAQDTPTEASSASEMNPLSSASPGFSVKVLNDSIPSPKKELTATINDAHLTIVYGSPSIKGRTVWGELVPFGSVWRTGANEATTIKVEENVTVAGKALPAGRYSLFTIPGESDWTLIFNKVADQWGAYEYDEGQDVLRVKVIPQEVDAMSETMEFSVVDGKVVFLWENLMVPFEVKKA